MVETKTTTAPDLWTVDRFITHLQRRGELATPFTAEERALAQAVAEAYYFAFHMTELPGPAPLNTVAAAAMYWGVCQVNERREGRAPRYAWTPQSDQRHPHRAVRHSQIPRRPTGGAQGPDRHRKAPGAAGGRPDAGEMIAV
jgi:hypothetical protein